MSPLLILGAGGHGKVVAETAISSGVASQIAFLDDHCVPPVLSWPIIGSLSHALRPEVRVMFPTAVVAIGHSATRLQWIHKLEALGYSLPAMIHPMSWVSPSAALGSGTVVFAQASVQAQARIGTGVILNTGCSVDHDVHLADGVHICPGARVAGGVYVGARSWIGLGACVIQQLRIGADVTVGAGAAVVHNLADGITAVGVPARPR